MADTPNLKIHGERYYRDHSSEAFPWRLWVIIDGKAIIGFGDAYHDALSSLMYKLERRGIVHLEVDWNRCHHEWDDNIPIDPGR